MKQPIEPNKEDCCNSGCDPCIFDVYEKQMKQYKEFLETGEASSDLHLENAITQLEYSFFVLVKAVNICKLHKLLFFRKLLVGDGKKVWWKAGDHFLIKYNSQEESCTRAYTPIKLNQDIQCDFSIIVKVYENGLVSNYLGKLNVGDETMWRGPYGSYEITPNKFKQIVMIAQGTGIAPFISIIENILSNEDDFTKILLLYCVKDVDAILLRDELYSYREYWNYSYKIFLSKKSHEKLKYQEPIIQHKLQSEDITFLKPLTSKDQFLLCGSSEFMKYFDTLIKSENGNSENIILF